MFLGQSFDVRMMAGIQSNIETTCAMMLLPSMYLPTWSWGGVWVCVCVCVCEAQLFF